MSAGREYDVDVADLEARLNHNLLACVQKEVARAMGPQVSLGSMLRGQDDAPEQEANPDPWAHRSRAMSCVTCMWYVRKEKSGPQPLDAREVGRCRRHAPTMTGYPVVFETDWCGDHKLDENRA